MIMCCFICNKDIRKSQGRGIYFSAREHAIVGYTHFVLVYLPLHLHLSPLLPSPFFALLVILILKTRKLLLLRQLFHPLQLSCLVSNLSLAHFKNLCLLQQKFLVSAHSFFLHYKLPLSLLILQSDCSPPPPWPDTHRKGSTMWSSLAFLNQSRMLFDIFIGAMTLTKHLILFQMLRETLIVEAQFMIAISLGNMIVINPPSSFSSYFSKLHC